MKQPIFKCDSSIKIETQNALNRVKIYNNLLQLLKGNGFEVDNENIEMIFSTPKQYVLNHLTKGQGAEINGIKVNAIKAFELLDIPKEIIEIVNELERTPRISNFESYTIENGSIVLTEKTIASIEERATVFAETEQQLDVWDKINQVANILNDLSKTLKFNNDVKFVSACFGFNSMDNNPHGVFKPDPKIINRLK